MTQNSAAARNTTPAVPMTAEQRATLDHDGYLIIGGVLRPMSPQTQPARMSWRQARQEVRVAGRTGAGDTDPGELAALVIQLDRAVAATR